MRIEFREVDLKDKIMDFSQYLATTDRIILSAKFGDGKTFFLNQLRSAHKVSDTL
jgi:tRNA A37 threonylcarbamoyladenosine biosynthesis protein TsaE